MLKVKVEKILYCFKFYQLNPFNLLIFHQAKYVVFVFDIVII